MIQRSKFVSVGLKRLQSMQALHSNLLPQDEESEIFPMASRKEEDLCITRMLLRTGGEQVSDAVTESEGEEDAEQSALRQQL